MTYNKKPHSYYLVLSLLLSILITSSCNFIQNGNHLFDTISSQNLFNEEIHTEGSSIENGFDATLEEVLHLISDYGYSPTYPKVFGTHTGTDIADAMDIARGGQYLSIPARYPSTAWYHYTDSTCNYSCQITEYIYWGLTTYLGGQKYE